MNDFTKEELAVLKHVLNTNVDGYKDPGLLNKIQSMIDNYCDHEPEGDYHVCVDKCKHCGVIINE